jgi:DNA-binding transcriptional MerR regulator
MQPLRIGRLARLANVNVQTLRFYERKGLLPKPQRRLSGYREYPAEAVGVVILIKRIQALGFSLKEIKELLALSKAPSTTMHDAADRLQSKLEEIDARIRELHELRSTLVKMVQSHRQGATRSFAPAFLDHIRQLSAETIAEDDEKPRDGRLHRPNKIAKKA